MGTLRHLRWSTVQNAKEEKQPSARKGWSDLQCATYLCSSATLGDTVCGYRRRSAFLNSQAKHFTCHTYSAALWPTTPVYDFGTSCIGRSLPVGVTVERRL
eukprot:6192132-Pleurochrysis_carterae.AAC.1